MERRRRGGRAVGRAVGRALPVTPATARAPGPQGLGLGPPPALTLPVLSRATGALAAPWGTGTLGGQRAPGGCVEGGTRAHRGSTEGGCLRGS